MLADLFFRLRAFLRRDLMERELNEELQAHFDQYVAKLTQSGLSEEEAFRRVRLEFGMLDQVSEECRDVRGVHWVEDLTHDLRYGLRMMRKERGFTAAALLVIALGIGVNTAVVSADHAVLFRALPYPSYHELVEIFQDYRPNPAMDRMPVAPANYFDWRAETKAFGSFAAWQETSFNLSGEDHPERVRVAEVSANLFDVLGVKPILGHGFESGVDSPGRDSEVMLSYSLWQRRFAGNPRVAGTTISANGKKYSVAGVMPRECRFPIGWSSADVEMWKPLALDGAQKYSRSDIALEVIGRLRTGTTVAQGEASLNGIARRLEKAYPETNKGWGVHLMLLADRGISDFRKLFVLLSIAVGVVLLIACANVANLLLARGAERHKELTLRFALGAQTNRLVRQLITEGVLLSLCGGLLGIGIGYLSVRALPLLAPVELPDLKNATLDMPVVLVSAGLSLLSGFLFSVLPALTLSRRSLRGNLQETGRSSTGTVQAARMKAMLLIGEVALTLVLLLCAGDLLNSFVSYMKTDPGFDATNVLTMRMSLSKQRYENPQQWRTFFDQAVDEVRAIPGVVATAAGTIAPMTGGGAVMRFHIAGASSAAGHSMVSYCRVTPDYFRVASIGLQRGRGLSASDTDEGVRVAVVNETFVRRQFGTSNPIGRRFFLDGDVNRSITAKHDEMPLEIVGVVRDTKEYNLFMVSPQMVYVPLAQDPQPAGFLLIKTSADPLGFQEAVRKKLAQFDPDQPVYAIRTLEQIESDEHAFFRFYTLLLAVFAAIALMLAVIGIYGVVSYAVNRRVREFGIRLALGSPRHKILTMVLSQAVWISFLGIGVGLALTWPATRLLTRVLQESMYLTLKSTGPGLFLILCLGIALTMFIACVVPARRASTADPIETLRCE